MQERVASARRGIRRKHGADADRIARDRRPGDARAVQSSLDGRGQPGDLHGGPHGVVIRTGPAHIRRAHQKDVVGRDCASRFELGQTGEEPRVLVGIENTVLAQLFSGARQESAHESIGWISRKPRPAFEIEDHRLRGPYRVWEVAPLIHVVDAHHEQRTDEPMQDEGTIKDSRVVAPTAIGNEGFDDRDFRSSPEWHQDRRDGRSVVGCGVGAAAIVAFVAVAGHDVEGLVSHRVEVVSNNDHRFAALSEPLASKRHQSAHNGVGRTAPPDDNCRFGLGGGDDCWFGLDWGGRGGRRHNRTGRTDTRSLSGPAGETHGDAYPDCESTPTHGTEPRALTLVPCRATVQGGVWVWVPPVSDNSVSWQFGITTGRVSGAAATGGQTTGAAGAAGAP